MSSEGFRVRTMTRKDLDLAIDWAAEEGWNPGLHDAECFYAADPNGFFLGELDGQAVSCISAVRYDETFGFMGFYIVRPGFRGRGFGMKTWDVAVAYMGDRNIGGDGVVEQQANYMKSGYRTAYRNIRYEGTGGGPSKMGLVDAVEAPFADLVEYDRAHFPARRPQFLRRWIHQPEGAALAAVQGGRIVGYGVVRACRKGFKIGPLFADDEQIAEDLFSGLSARAEGRPIFLDTPEPNRAAVAMAKRHGMVAVFETARMYLKGAPDLPLHQVFGVTTFELG